MYKTIDKSLSQTQSVDEFFSSIGSQKLDLKIIQQACCKLLIDNYHSSNEIVKYNYVMLV